MNDKEFEELWQECKESDKKREEKYNALSKAEKKHLSKKYSDAFYDRISDDPTGGSDKD